LKVLVCGAGAAGIDVLHHALTAFEGLHVQVQCFDKNPEVGGTWYENRYPGCACDGPSPSYQFPWRPNPEWSKYYSGSGEIWEYMKGIVLDEGLDRFIQLNTEVKKATWDDTKSAWTVVLRATDGSRQWEEDFNIFLNGTGFVKYVVVSRVLPMQPLTTLIALGNGQASPALNLLAAACFTQQATKRDTTSRESVWQSSVLAVLVCRQ
jgi:hypothetical protein